MRDTVQKQQAKSRNVDNVYAPHIMCDQVILGAVLLASEAQFLHSRKLFEMQNWYLFTLLATSCFLYFRKSSTFINGYA